MLRNDFAFCYTSESKIRLHNIFFSNLYRKVMMVQVSSFRNYAINLRCTSFENISKFNFHIFVNWLTTKETKNLFDFLSNLDEHLHFCPVPISNTFCMKIIRKITFGGFENTLRQKGNFVNFHWNFSVLLFGMSSTGRNDL